MSHEKSPKNVATSRRTVLYWMVSAIPATALISGCRVDNDTPTESGEWVVDVDEWGSWCVIYEEGDWRIIESNGFPNHETGEFPPEITDQENYFRMPLEPEESDTVTPLNGWLFGVGLNGVVFDPTGPFWEGLADSGWTFEVLSDLARTYLSIDFNNSHCQKSGEYHYHGMPTGLIDVVSEGKGATGRLLMLGYASDGFPIYGPFSYDDAMDPSSEIRLMKSSYRLLSGMRPDGPGGAYDGTMVEDYEYDRSTGDLDECNGRFGVTPEYPDGTYYYVITEEFPSIPRMTRGEPDESFYHGLPGLDAVPAGLLGYTGT